MKKYRGWLSVCLWVSFAVQAHQPVLNLDSNPDQQHPYLISKPEVSKAIFSRLTGTPHFYQIKSDTAFHFYVGMTMPKPANCESFTRMSFSILDQDYKMIAELNGEQYEWKPWYEEYGKQWYWIGPEYGKDFKSTHVFDAGTYYIKVYNADNTGNYVLTTGDVESFGPVIMFKMLFTLPKINRIFWDEKRCELGAGAK